MNRLHKKLGIKENSKIIFRNVDSEFYKNVTPLPEGCNEGKQLRGKYDVVIYFAKVKINVVKDAEKLLKALEESGILWIAYPKKYSGIETDLNRDKCWDLFNEFGYRPVNLVSLNEQWSAMRFKPETSISTKHKQVHSSEEFKKLIDPGKKLVIAPDDLKKELYKDETVKNYFNSLAYSHRKEYVQWIIEAKRKDTRARRIAKTIEMLKAGKKNPNDK